MTYAKGIPSLKGIPVGHIQTSETSWIDDSPGGRPEWETEDVKEAIAQFQAGRRIIAVEDAQKALLDKVQENGDKIDRLTEAIDRLVGSLGTAFGTKGPKGPSPPSPDDDQTFIYR